MLHASSARARLTRATREQECKELNEEQSRDFTCEPLEVRVPLRAGAYAPRLELHTRTLGRAAQDNIFEWHFALRGPPDTEFQGGIYHGRIVLPPEYPFKPPTFSFLTVRAPGCAWAPSLTPGLSRTGASRSTRRSASASAHTTRSTGSLPGACALRW